MIRDVQGQLSPELLQYSFNRYTVFAVMETAEHIRYKMKKLLEDASIQSLDGYELLSNDFDSISKKLNETLKAMGIEVTDEEELH
jgi:hypothetical protein